MLTLTVKPKEFFNSADNKFIKTPGCVLELEHSLVSLSKWESKFRKPFLSTSDKTSLEVFGYVEEMIISYEGSIENLAYRLSEENYNEINAYLASEQSATTFRETPQQKAKGRSEIITSELIYYWMNCYQIPMECEKWHLNRLFALIKIHNVKSAKPKKRSKNEIAQEYRDLNEQRKAQLKTNG